VSPRAHTRPFLELPLSPSRALRRRLADYELREDALRDELRDVSARAAASEAAARARGDELAAAERDLSAELARFLQLTLDYSEGGVQGALARCEAQSPAALVAEEKEVGARECGCVRARASSPVRVAAGRGARAG
jgi:uncharacterized protein involved in exopolysaccharide biosynthesis